MVVMAEGQLLRPLLLYLSWGQQQQQQQEQEQYCSRLVAVSCYQQWVLVACVVPRVDPCGFEVYLG